MSVITEFTGVDDIEDTDLLLVQNSQTVGFKMTGLKYKKLHDIIIASSLTVTGPKIHAGSSVRIYFNTDIAGANTSTAMVINYNNTNITVKAPKDGSLIDYTAKAVGNSYLYCQAYTTLELLYDGTNFVIIGNPVVISNADYTIYTDGRTVYNVGTQTSVAMTVGGIKTTNISATLNLTRISSNKYFATISVSATPDTNAARWIKLNFPSGYTNISGGNVCGAQAALGPINLTPSPSYNNVTEYYLAGSRTDQAFKFWWNGIVQVS